MRFAALFKTWMQREGLTSPSHAADRLGCAVQTAYDYASGQSLPPKTRLHQIAQAMGFGERTVETAVKLDRSAARKPRQDRPRVARKGA